VATTPPAPVITPPPLGAMPDLVPPAFSGELSVRLTRGTLSGRKRATFRFALSEPAWVRVALTRSAKGVRSGTRCVAPTRTGTRCSRQIFAGTTTRSITKSGAGVLALSATGLRKGSYRATLVATDAAKNHSLAKRVRFTVR
jgi:hypothetical protein